MNFVESDKDLYIINAQVNAQVNAQDTAHDTAQDTAHDTAHDRVNVAKNIFNGDMMSKINDLIKDYTLPLRQGGIHMKNLQIRNSTAEFLIFTKQNKEKTIEITVDEESVWLSQK